MEMMKPSFIEKDKRPSEKSLSDTLENSYSAFAELVNMTAQLSQEWKFYSPKYGWNLKVFHKKKALFYLIPGAGQFTFGMALRENEKDLVLGSDVSEDLKTALAAGEKIMEGYPLKIIVKTRDQLTDIRKVIAVLDAARRLNL